MQAREIQKQESLLEILIGWDRSWGKVIPVFAAEQGGADQEDPFVYVYG